MEIKGRAQRTGFTLIELLVVVGIIAVLVAILLPSLGGARRVARTTLCGTNLRSIDQAMANYAAEFQNAILGGAHTSSASLFNGTFTALAPGISESSNVPDVISSNDWLTPTAKVMGITYNDGPTPAARIARFMQFNAFKAFICPENDVVCTGYTGDGGPAFPVHQMISYNTALCFQYTNGSFDNSVTLPAAYVNLGAYRPKVQLVGLAADKVFIADGGRWWNGTLPYAPDTNGAVKGASPGGMTSDYGPWDFDTRAYLRGTATVDGRSASMRHGSRKPNATLATFKFNLAFFDGHVETRNGLDGADPSIWVPTGAKPSTTEYISGTDADFKKRYGLNPLIR